MGAGCLSDDARERTSLVPALRKDRPEPDALVSALGALHAHGRTVDWQAFFDPARPRRVPLPTYAFQRERFWLDAPSSSAAVGSGEPAGRYSLSGSRLDFPNGTVIHTVNVGPAIQAYLADHVVYDRIVVPGAFYVAVFLSIAESHWPDLAVELRDVQFVHALAFDQPSDSIVLHVLLTPTDGEHPAFSATLSTRSGDAWVTHATAVLSRVRPGDLPARTAIELPALDLHSDSVAPLQQVLGSKQLFWGPQWRWLRQSTHVRERTSVGRLEAPGGVSADDAPIPAGLIDNTFALILSAAADPSPPTRRPRTTPLRCRSPSSASSGVDATSRHHGRSVCCARAAP
jgi:acyl transferase domain-containing protein